MSPFFWFFFFFEFLYYDFNENPFKLTERYLPSNQTTLTQPGITNQIKSLAATAENPKLKWPVSETG